MAKNIYTAPGIFTLESGAQLASLEIAYHTFGTLNAEQNNVIWVCHALTANSDVFDWWPGLFGTDACFDPERYFIVCANNLGSCYGTTGPLSINPYAGQPWFSHFPHITIRDMVAAHDLLRQHLGIKKIHVAIGGSQGAQQLVEWNILHPSVFENTILIAGNAKHSAWGIAFNESQRLAIKADRTYYANSLNGGEKGLAAARSIALLSYRHYGSYNDAQQEQDNETTNDFKASSYQRYQGQKLVDRFNAYSYVTLANAMDAHNVGRKRSSVETALNAITARTLVIGISSDQLFPPQEQLFMARHIKASQARIIDSIYGHDGFLLETKQLESLISEFLKPETGPSKNVTGIGIVKQPNNNTLTH